MASTDSPGRCSTAQESLEEGVSGGLEAEGEEWYDGDLELCTMQNTS